MILKILQEKYTMQQEVYTYIRTQLYEIGWQETEC